MQRQKKMSKHGKTSKSPKCKANMKREAENQKTYKRDITEYKNPKDFFGKR